MKSTFESLIKHKLLLVDSFPFFSTYSFNDFHAPHLNGGSPVDLGMVLLFIDELAADANNPKMAKLLSVTELTCKNWIKKLKTECLCDIEWINSAKTGKRFIVNSYGIFNTELYDQFRPFVKLVIHYWRENQTDECKRFEGTVSK